MSVKTNVEEMLVEKGIITRAQLERVKKVQFDLYYGKVSYARFHMLFGFPSASGRESVPLVCPHCRL